MSNREDTKVVGQAQGVEESETNELGEPDHSDHPGRLGSKSRIYGNHEAMAGRKRPSVSAAKKDVPTT